MTKFLESFVTDILLQVIRPLCDDVLTIVYVYDDEARKCLWPLTATTGVSAGHEMFEQKLWRFKANAFTRTITSKMRKRKRRRKYGCKMNSHCIFIINYYKQNKFYFVNFFSSKIITV